MKNPPEIQWLIDRWGLPDDGPAIERVREFLEAERVVGSTALSLASSVPSWGHAAAAPADSNDSPLVLLEDGAYLQSRRCYLAEQSVAGRILHFADSKIENALSLSSEDGTDPVVSLFDGAAEDDLQVKAARTALQHRLTIITGGPGTGKTYTLARILALLVGEGQRPDFIRLAAPTGKAADRMKQSVEASVASLQTPDETRRESLLRIARRSSTLHTLLGYNPSTSRCRHDAATPLPCEVLIVDECSMVDLHLWKVLLEALPDSARLILLGDPLQLQSVGQGNIFGDLVGHAKSDSSPLHGSLVRLTESRRFRDRPGISKLAEALEKSDAQAAESLLRDALQYPGITWIDLTKGMLPYDKIPTTIRDAIGAVANASSPEAALEALGKVCILTAHRSHSLGAGDISKAITRELANRGVGRIPNEPVIINTNDPETGLRNGAVGILHTDEQGVRRAWFRDGDGNPQAYSVGSLPDNSPAWAITIHRSQGSEYDDVLIILPKNESPLNTRELLYTAITRARKNVIIAGTIEAVKAAVNTLQARITLLGKALDPTSDTREKPTSVELHVNSVLAKPSLLNKPPSQN